MIETKFAISLMIALFFFGMLLGCVFMGLASTDSYRNGYMDGFEMGRTEEKERIINKIDKHMRG